MARTRFTSKDLDLLPSEEGTRYEIIDGELYVTKAPHFNHQVVCSRTGYVLELWNEQTGLGVVGQAPGVVFAEDDDVVPDIIWVSKQRLPEVLGSDGHFHAAPELIIEVLSPGATNIRRDRQIKLNLYTRRAVPEYWVVDWQRRQVDVYRREDAQLILAATLTEGDTLTSSVLPGFACPVASLFVGVGIV